MDAKNEGNREEDEEKYYKIVSKTLLKLVDKLMINFRHLMNFSIRI